jgi:hypothetical protein
MKNIWCGLEARSEDSTLLITGLTDVLHRILDELPRYVLILSCYVTGAASAHLYTLPDALARITPLSAPHPC